MALNAVVNAASALAFRKRRALARGWRRVVSLVLRRGPPAGGDEMLQEDQQLDLHEGGQELQVLQQQVLQLQEGLLQLQHDRQELQQAVQNLQLLQQRNGLENPAMVDIYIYKRELLSLSLSLSLSVCNECIRTPLEIST